MNSNYITFDYQSGQMRRDFVREAATKNVNIYMVEKETPAPAQIDLTKMIQSLKSLFVPQTGPMMTQAEVEIA